MKERNKSTKLLTEKKGKRIRQKIIEEGNENTKSLWRNVKDMLNWKEGGPPTELRNSTGKLETKPSVVADIFHEALEKKVNNITESLKTFEETVEEEEHALRKAGIRQGEEQFNFQKVTLEEVEEILLNLPRKTSAGDDQISYMEIKDASCYVAPMLNAIVNLIIEKSHWPKVWSNIIIKPLYKG